MNCSSDPPDPVLDKIFWDEFERLVSVFKLDGFLAMRLAEKYVNQLDPKEIENRRLIYWMVEK